MAEVATLLQAIAALLWPVFALAVLLLFRQELRTMTSRLKTIEGLGIKAELDQLRKTAANAAEEVRELAPSNVSDATEAELDDDEFQATTADNTSQNQSTKPMQPSVTDNTDIDRVLTLSTQSPQAALMLLSSIMERELRQLLIRRGISTADRPISFPQAIRLLEEEGGGLPKDITLSVRQFWEVRNEIVHGGTTEPGDAVKAIDTGILILKTLQAVPPAKWKEAVFRAARRYMSRHGEDHFTRQGLIQEELEQIKRDTATAAKFPQQTMSWAIQQLEQDGSIERIGPGVYRITTSESSAETNNSR